MTPTNDPSHRVTWQRERIAYWQGALADAIEQERQARQNARIARRRLADAKGGLTNLLKGQP